MDKLIERFAQNKEQIAQKIQKLASSEFPSQTLGGQTINSIIHELVEAFSSQLQDRKDSLVSLVTRLTRQTILAGDSVDHLRFLLDRMLELTVITVLKQPNEELQDYKLLAAPIELAKSELINIALRTQQDIITKQGQALLELSTPVIPIFDHILVVPLIGTIDTQRGKQVMDNLLDGIIANKAEVVLIDISGVPIVDTQVAHHIIKTVQAARLLGARCILVGIRPEFAQTIVKLGIDFNDIVTKNSLQAGVELALTWNNYKLQKFVEE